MIKYPTIQFLKWDTENFQKKIGKVSFEQAISYDEYNDLLIQGRLENYELLYIFVPEKKDFLKDICKEDMRLVDQKVIFSKKLNTQKDIVNISPFVFEYQEKCVSEQLLKLSLESGRFSRFYIDDNRLCITFYAKIGRECFAGCRYPLSVIGAGSHPGDYGFRCGTVQECRCTTIYLFPVLM